VADAVRPPLFSGALPAVKESKGQGRVDRPAHGGEPERAAPNEATDRLPAAGAPPREPIADAIPTVAPYPPRPPSPEPEAAVAEAETVAATESSGIAAPEPAAGEATPQPAVAVAADASAQVPPHGFAATADQPTDEAPSAPLAEPDASVQPEIGAQDGVPPIAKTIAEPAPDVQPKADSDTPAQVAEVVPELTPEPAVEAASDVAAATPSGVSHETVAQPAIDSVAVTVAGPAADAPPTSADLATAPEAADLPDPAISEPQSLPLLLPPNSYALAELDRSEPPQPLDALAVAPEPSLDTDRPRQGDPQMHGEEIGHSAEIWRAQEIWSAADASEISAQRPTQGLALPHAQPAFEAEPIAASAALAQPPLANDHPVTRPLSAAVSTPYLPPSWPPVALPSRPNAGDFVRYLRLALGSLAVLIMVLAAVVLLLVVAYRWIDPPASTLIMAQRLGGTTIQQRWVPLERISPNLVQAVVLSEDGAFCRHRGIDWSALQDAIDSARDGNVRGGSTITMQVVKNLFLWSSRSYIRKAIEIPLAYLVELVWPKRRILEIYLNIAEWGDGLFGAEAASRHHFNKRALQLSPQEAALLAVSLPNPIEREAGYPGPLTRRLAANLLVRMRAVRSATTCVGVRKFSF
jgi:monofunctional biosynthetic peptidoglycan transglycosylase